MKAVIKKIQNIYNLNLVTLELEKHEATEVTEITEITMVSLELHESLQLQSSVTLGVKATSVFITTDKESHLALSIDNQLKVNIVSIEIGELLCTLLLKTDAFVLESIITSKSAKKMQLQEGMQVYALINATDISIVEVC